MELIPDGEEALEGMHESLMEYLTAGQRLAYPTLPRPEQAILASEAPVRGCPMPIPVAPARTEFNGMVPSVFA